MLAFVVIMLVGTAGYWEVSAGKATLLDCAYMTFITIATIGYGEVIDLSASPGGGVFAVTGDDSKNLVITLSAKQLNPGARVVARCHDVRFVDKIRQVGADDIVSPDFTGALRIASSMLRPAVVSFLDEMLRSDQGLRVEEIVLPQGGRERRIAELAPADSDYVLLAVRRDGRWEFNPTPESTAKPGTTLVVMATPAGRTKLERRVAA